MLRSEWSALSLRFGEPVLFDVTRTPLGGVVEVAPVIGTFGQPSSNATAEITIVRYDEKDAPTPFNIDKYTVWTDLKSHNSLSQMIAGASTRYNQNLRDFFIQYVFIIKQDAGPDHWLPDPPAPVLTVVRRNR